MSPTRLAFRPAAIALLVASALFLSAASARAQGTLYLAAGGTPGPFAVVDTETGHATILDWYSSMSGLAPHPMRYQRLFLSDNSLYTLEQDASSRDEIGLIDGVQDGAHGLAYDRETAILYGLAWGQFFVINQATGVHAYQLTDPPEFITGLAAGRGGVFGSRSSGPRLYFYDTGLDSWSLIGTISEPCGSSLAYDPNADVLYSHNGTNLIRIDPDTAAATVVGPLNLPSTAYGTGGMAFVALPPALVPAVAPPALMLGALALVGCGLYALVRRA